MLSKKIITEIKTQFSTIIHVLCCDNALKYTQKRVSQFYASHGIYTRPLCPHTSQQNEVVKTNVMHLLDVTRTLLIHTYALKIFWVELFSVLVT